MSKRTPKPTPADKAFTAPEKSTLGDLKLEPWTPDRMIKAQELGQIFPNTGRSGWEQYRTTNVYPGAVRDVILFVFLSQLPPEEVEDATWEDAKAFGAKRGLHNQDSTAFWEAYALWMKVQTQIKTSIAVPRGSQDGGDSADHEEDDQGPKA